MIRRPLRLVGIVGAVLLGVLGAGMGGVYLWAGHHYRAAQEDLDHYRPAEARRHLDCCLKVWPHDARLYLLAARAARLSEDFEAAERYLGECERLDEEMAEPAALEWALIRAQNGDLRARERVLQARVEANDPEAPRILEALTVGYLRMYRLLEAMYCLRLWLQRQPDNLHALLLRGQARQRVHDHAHAAADFRRVVELDPERDEARLALANSLLEAGKHREAIRELEFLRGRQPDNPEVLVRLAFGLNHLGKEARAREILDGLLASHPRYGPALTGRGQIAVQAGRPREAEGLLRRALAVNPTDRRALFFLYQALEQQGRSREAREVDDRRKGLEKNLERMIRIGNSLMPVKPNDPALHCEMGTILLSLGEEELGFRWLQSALKQDPNYAPAHGALADYYRRHGDRERAARHRQLARAGRTQAPADSPPATGR